jgi:hypothetical protein
MDVNDPLYTVGSVELLQSSGTSPTVYFVGGSLYFVHEYVVAPPETSIPVFAHHYNQMMRQ